ncbi:hypothetical protein [Deinococcus aquaticus]|uniref:DUF262 domain-containing protein n=1 Tax=Deinococcus aquaticus TaxID=328692 RepID=A0ABY7V5V8_9DEIO|nr:hypothetical protein [Deinococcus aquaticus]WDA59964.1 hypothetical protein M8445_07115 [Deinococcus aquaticus]
MEKNRDGGINPENRIILHDNRTDCYSIAIVLRIGDYLDVIEHAYKHRGGILLQRDALKTKTALQIRSRMVEDIISGAVLPPIVIGMLYKDIDFDKNSDDASIEVAAKLLTASSDINLSIIDGMQRTTALKEAATIDTSVKDKFVRIEIWFAKSVNSLLYRMLILNTGQIPWNLRRQFEVIYNPVINEIASTVEGIEIFSSDDGRRRSTGGQYQSDDLIELFLVFGSRKEDVDSKEKLTDEFVKLDFINATGDFNLSSKFHVVLSSLVKIDKAFSTLTDPDTDNKRFSKGKDLFKSQTACVGFVNAAAIFCIGRPGADRDIEEQNQRIKQLTTIVDRLVNKFCSMSSEGKRDFLDLERLSQLLEKKTGKVGDFERTFFTKAFTALFDSDGELSDMTPCWRAY